VARDDITGNEPLRAQASIEPRVSGRRAIKKASRSGLHLAAQAAQGQKQANKSVERAIAVATEEVVA
jgi:hypothetical protein